MYTTEDTGVHRLRFISLWSIETIGLNNKLRH